ncbi:MAG: hypothetical protein ISR60_03200 [Anaerolineales bacterium]|nr:hypothetical protein [Anaerolineales bacterium]
MPRRRRFAPKGPPPLHRPPLENRAHRALQRAHRLMEIGDYANAGDIFDRVARGAHDRGLMRQAPRLYLQAGRAYILAGATKQGFGLLQQGLQIYAGSQLWGQFQQTGSRAVDELQQFGHADLAKELENWLQETIPANSKLAESPIRSAPTKQLPITCTSCGGPLKPNEIEWLNPHTAECPYCGIAIHAEQ